MLRFAIVLATSAMMACGGNSPPQPPVITPPAGGETINGTERIGWDQPAADAVELAAIRYAMYVDGTRTELTGVACAPSSTTARFSCASPLPSLARGAHTLQISSFVTDGTVLESARSAALNVTVVPVTAAVDPRRGAAPPEAGTFDAARPPFDALVGAFASPTDLAVAPDGRLFVAERSGRILIVRGGIATPLPAIDLARSLPRVQLLAIALDPQFERTHFVFVLYARAQKIPAATFAIVRLRESGDALGDATTLVDGVAASDTPAGALRFGPDRRLYAAFDARGNERLASDPSSLNGKVVRFGANVTTPSDPPNETAVIVDALLAPAALGWQPSSQVLWIAERGTDRAAQLRVVTGGTPAAYALPADVQPTSLVFASASAADPFDTLLLGSEGAAQLLRIAIDKATARPMKIERLTAGKFGAVQALAAAPDGSVYLGMPATVGRMRDWGFSIPNP